MPTLPQRKLLAAILAVAAFLALPAVANATLSYTKDLKQPTLFYAKDNGTGAKRIGPGYNSLVSPDGESVIYERSTANGTELRLFSLEAGKSERLMSPLQEGYLHAWSPDSTMVAALTGPPDGPFKLLVIDVETLKRTKIATGFFNGFSFSPNGEELVYGFSTASEYPLKSDIYREGVDGTRKVALSHNHSSAYPLWGPSGQIVFARQLGAKTRQYGPANQIFVMNENGQRISQVTHTKVNPLAQGLSPLQFSANGNRLLTEFGGQDQSYAVAVSLVTGAERSLSPGNAETGFQGAALSPDGQTVLGTVGLGFGGNAHPRVVTKPWNGGKEKVLVAGAYGPSWGN
jgi:dipeptidyl aminopeptidase/acylaminoacyl peptidase